jgi:hypothetical protein
LILVLKRGSHSESVFTYFEKSDEWGGVLTTGPPPSPLIHHCVDFSYTNLNLHMYDDFGTTEEVKSMDLS